MGVCNLETTIDSSDQFPVAERDQLQKQSPLESVFGILKNLTAQIAILALTQCERIHQVIAEDRRCFAGRDLLAPIEIPSKHKAINQFRTMISPVYIMMVVRVWLL